MTSNGNHLRPLGYHWRPVFQQNRIQAGGNVVQPLRGIRQRHTTEAEMFSIIGIDGERRLEFAESIAAGTEDYRQPVSARRSIELVFIAIRQLGEFFPLVF